MNDYIQPNMNPFFFIVSEFPREGKSTAAKILGEMLGLKYGDTSDILYREVAKDLGVTEGELRASNKEVIRPYLIAKGNEICEKDPCGLSKALIRGGCSIVGGVRRQNELKSIIEILQVGHNTITVVFLAKHFVGDRSKFDPFETTNSSQPSLKRDNSEITFPVAKEIISVVEKDCYCVNNVSNLELVAVDNSGTIEDLTKILTDLFKK